MNFDGVMGFIHTGLMQLQQHQDVHGAVPVQGGQGNTLATRPLEAQGSTVSSGGAPPPPPPGPNPAQDARAMGATGGGYDSVDSKQRAIDEAMSALREDPDYASKVELRDQLSSLKSAFNELEARFGGLGGPDFKLSWDDVNFAAIHRDRGASAQALALADFLLENKDLFAAMDKNGDGMIEPGDISAKLKELSQSISKMEFDAKKSARVPKTEAGDGTTRAGTDGAGTGGTGGTNNTKADAPLHEFTPFRSEKTDPVERTADAIGHWQNEIDKLSNLIAKEKDPGKLAALQAQMSKASNVLQSMMSLMQQLQTMMSNIAKMWSDMAMTAIRNTH
jgi:hypothetical protein